MENCLRIGFLLNIFFNFDYIGNKVMLVFIKLNVSCEDIINIWLEIIVNWKKLSFYVVLIKFDVWLFE